MAKRGFDVITVGSATVDVFVYTNKTEQIKIIDEQCEHDLIAYPSGEKILINDLHFSTGGGGTNTAVAFARLGLKTGFVGNIGCDENGTKVKSLLHKEKVAFLGTVSNEKTGYSIILDSREHDRTILTYKESNNHLYYQKLPLPKLKTRWFYFSSMMEESYQTLEKLAAFAQSKGIKVAFNPSSYLTKKGLGYAGSLLKKTTVLILNKEEAEMLVGKDRIEKVLAKLRAAGPALVVITDGKHGAWAHDGKTIYCITPHKVNVVETTGAGDAFASGFLAGYLKKKDVCFALRLGQVNAESVIQHFGAKEILLTYSQAQKAIKKEQCKVVSKKC
ncbi:carbohydrate kinase family protein [Candidatus Woesearchaeota archaeon]|nr:carbohydrate kinase family protein [Candidatus Woesearchaeota archaeon]